MAEDGGRDDHFCVVAALENFQVGAAGERGPDTDADFARLKRGRRDFLDENFFLRVEDGGFHERIVGAEGTRLKLISNFKNLDSHFILALSQWQPPSGARE